MHKSSTARQRGYCDTAVQSSNGEKLVLNLQQINLDMMTFNCPLATKHWLFMDWQLKKKNNDNCRIRTCAGKPKRFLIFRLNHSAKLPFLEVLNFRSCNLGF